MKSIDAANDKLSLDWLERQFDSSLPTVIFDFDGVLCSPIEDLVYKLPERRHESDALHSLADKYGIVSDFYDTRYLRHLLLQAVLDARGELPGKGPLLPLAGELARARRPFFILTARSGRIAIKRMMAFLDVHQLEPQEIFCVGRVPKGRQLSLIRSTVPELQHLVYFEDTKRHVLNSKRQFIPNFTNVHVAWVTPDWSKARALLDMVLPLSLIDEKPRNVA